MHLTMIQQQQQQQQTIVSSNGNQQQQQIKMQPAKVTKVRRTRQPRNPQLSVARRNERERNRVKMVNNGFALLREHLPVEDLQALEQQSGGCETPDGTSSGGKSVGQKAKKFSKVETLRAAIQRIRMLEELIRSTEPGFESINITSTANSQLNMYDEEPLSVCGGEALSCMSSSSPHSSSTATTTSTQQAFNHNVNLDTTLQHHHHQNLTYQQQQQHQPEHFIKLEPQYGSQQPQHPSQQLYNVPSPQNSQHSHSSGQNTNSNSNSNSNPTQQYQQVHHQHQQQLEAIQQSTMSTVETLQEEPSHTHLWIQQHQSSFIEQQQLHYQQQQQQQQQVDQTNWYSQQQQQQQQQLQQVDQSNTIQSSQTSPVWFSNSPGSSAVVTVGQVAAHNQTQPTISRFNHQISLYSQ